jgi:hypothetical protein
MSSVDQLLLILLAIYVSECLLYLRAGAMALGNWLGTWRVLDGGLSVGSSGGGVVFLDPSPWAVAYECEPWPVAVSPYGLLSISGWPGPGAAGDSTGAILWADITRLRADGRWLLVNGTRYAECASGAMASYLAKVIDKIRLEATHEDREQAIGKALGDTFNVDSARSRYNEVAGRIFGLRFSGTTLFVLVFALVPIAQRTLPVWQWAPWLVLAVLVQTWLNAWGVSRVVRVCSELTGEERFKAKLLAAVSPVAAMRCGQIAAARLLPLHHPLVVAHLLGPPPFFRSLAERAWRELSFPIIPVQAESDSLAAQIFDSYTVAQRQSLELFFDACNVQPQQLLRSPMPDSPEVLAYCPRCLGQYLSLDTRCHTCGDRALVPLVR